MASKRIQGITIEIGGNTTGLTKALEKVDKQLSKTQGNLKDINKLLKFSPGNTELLVQKQKNLQKSIQTTSERLKELKKARDESTASDEQYEAWTEANKKIQKSIDATTKEAQKLAEQLKKTEEGTPEYESLIYALSQVDAELEDLKAEQVDVRREFGNPMSTDQYDSLQREIIETEQQLESLTDEYKAFGSVAQQKIAAVGQSMQEVGAKVSGVGQRMQEIGSVVPNKLKEIGSAINEHVLQPMLQVAKVVGAAGFAAGTAMTKGAVDAAAEYEQLVGGVETLFKDSSATVIKNARNAYKTSGKSANDYMKTVTAFSASLLQSLDGNTQRSAKMADMAIRDMSDNANKFGTDMASVEAAYQGFAKQQYTLLDNLKLGYGGTKAEMERLIRDAERLDSTFQVTHKTVKKGKEVNDELAYSYADIISAIHIVQENMGVTGTTAAEASKTIEGSMAAAKAAWSNLLTAIGTGDDAKGAARKMLDAAGTYLKDNLFPTIKTSLSGLSDVFDYLLDRVIFYLPEITKTVLGWLGKIPEWVNEHIISKLPWLFESLYITVSQTLWDISDSIAEWLGDGSTTSEIFTGLKTSLDNIISAFQTIGGALKELWEKTLKPYLQPKLKKFIETTLPKLTGVIDDIATGISSVIDWFNDLDPEIKNAILDVGLAVIAGSFLTSGIGKVIEKGGSWITNIGDIITKISGAGGLINIVKNLIGWLTGPSGIVFALASVVAWAIVHWDDIKKAFSDAMSAIHDKMKTWLDGINRWFDDLNSKISNVVSSITRGIRKIINNAKKTIKGYFDSIIGWAEDVLSKIGLIQKPRTTYTYANRGAGAGRYTTAYASAYRDPVVFTQPTVLQTPSGPKQFGDGAGAEVVLSMSKLKELVGSGAGTTNMSITINAQPGQSAEDIAAAVKRVFVREMQQRSAAYV